MERREAPEPHALRLHDARDWFLDVRCACGRSTILPVAKLAGTNPRHVTLGRVLRRLRCASCWAAPAGVNLEEKAQGAAYRRMGCDGGWSVALL